MRMSMRSIHICVGTYIKHQILIGPVGPCVRVLLAPYSAMSRELSGAAKASLRLGLGHPLWFLRPAASFLPHQFVSLMPTEAIAYLITISSSSINSLCDSYLACLLPTIHLAILPHSITELT
jgi:hypothetical protein